MPADPLCTSTVVDLVDPLRSEVGWLRRCEHRRVFNPRLHVGVPGSPRSITSDGLGPLTGPPWPPPRWVDDAMRRDVCDRMVSWWVSQVGPQAAWCWMTRPGVPRIHDEDPAWQAAATWAFDAHGVALRGFIVVTRYGWRDPLTQQERLWKRLRLVR